MTRPHLLAATPFAIPAILGVVAFALTLGLCDDLLAQPDGPIVVVVEDPIEPELDRCCRYIAIESDPDEQCFVSGVDCTTAVPGFPTLHKCNGEITSRVITTLYDRCEDQLNKACVPKGAEQVYHVGVGELGCPDRPAEDGNCPCSFSLFEDEEDEITKKHCAGNSCTTPLPPPVVPAGNVETEIFN